MVEWRHRRITAELMIGDIGMNVKIAFIQLLPEHSLDKNLEIGKNACIEAKEMGAELILAPNACPMEINRLSALRTRAYENMVAVATCNYPEGHPDCNGRSTLFDGVPWLRNEPGSRDMCVFEAPGSAGVYVADLNLDKLRAHRSQDIMGDKYRHPHKYGILADENVRDVIGGDFVHW